MEWAMVLVPVLLLLLGFPLFIVLLATSAVLLLGFMNVPAEMVPQLMFGSIDKFSLLAVPFFLFVGEIMGVGGMSKRIVDWVLALLGNAIICGTFSNPHDRYQSRLMWMPVLVVLLARARDPKALQPIPESGT